MSELPIIYEDIDILVVNKPAGLGTQAPRQFDSLEARVRQYRASSLGPDERTPYLGIPHRLDRCVSGVIVFAKRRKAAQRISLQFERREVQKIYVARVEGFLEPVTGKWSDYLRKIEGEPRVEVVGEHEDGAKLARLSYEITAHPGEDSILRIHLETGRMHQIRVQAASRGYPIRGDRLYGSKLAFGPEPGHERERQIALHAAELTLEHPRSREQVSFSAPPEGWPAN